MRKYVLSFIILLLINSFGCDDKDRFPETSMGIITTVDVNQDKNYFDINDLQNASVEFVLDVNNFGGNLVPQSVAVRVARTSSVNAAETTVANSKIYTIVGSFPSTITLQMSEICDVLGIGIGTVTSAQAIDVILEITTTSGVVYTVGTNNSAGVNTTYELGTFRRRFFIGCDSNILPGTYRAVISGANRLARTSENTVKIRRQVITLDANTWLNFMHNIYTITDLSAGFYEDNIEFPGQAKNQPVGIMESCGNISLFNNALLTMPSPSPQRTFSSVSGNWDAASQKLTISWKDAAGNIEETTIFSRIGD